MDPFRATSDIDEWYTYCLMVSSPVREYMNILYKYGKECRHITDCGTGEVHSAWAFAKALKDTKHGHKLLCMDVYMGKKAHILTEACHTNKLHFLFYIGTDLLGAPEDTDMVFFDTWRVYGQAKRELELWHNRVSKYIIIHGTTKYGLKPEENYRNENNFPAEETTRGIIPAIQEFLDSNKNWEVEKIYVINEGLTILKKVT